MMRLRLPFFALALLILSGVAHGQSVQWQPARGNLPMGQTVGITLVFDGCEPKDQPTPPAVDGLALQFYGKSESTSIVNLTVSRSVTLTYAARLTKNQRVEIPAFDVETDKGKLRVAPARYDPTGATVGNSGASLDSAATAKLTPTPNSVWAGEVFALNATVDVASRFYPQIQPAFEWDADPLVVESWPKPDPFRSTTGSEAREGLSYNTRAIARAPGSVKLNSANHAVNLSVTVSGFGFFQQRQYDQYSITSNTPTVEVKPLPTPPAGFTGAVGQFKLTSKVVPLNAAVGEPVTWTVELSGTGNWPDVPGLPARDVSRDFNVVQPQPRRTAAEGKLFDVTLSEDVVLVPTKAGTYTLGPINFVCFDPQTGTYKTITAPRAALTITAPEASKSPFTAPSIQINGESREPVEKFPAPGPTLSANPPPVPTAPSGIPRDPMLGSATAPLPLSARDVLIALLLPVSALAALWMGLALKRAYVTDPLRPRREARARAAATLVKLRKASPADVPALILQWQRDTAALWEISHAAPSAAVFFNVGGVPPPRFDKPRGEGTPPTSTTSAVWSALWREADRALYADKEPLSADWIKRAEAALAANQVPGFASHRIFLPRNFAPFLFSMGLIAAAFAPVDLHAEDSAAAYRRGDFASAEKNWRDSVGRNPADWIARHNLSLALAQQDRWGESAAHATVAFVQHPNDPAVRWHFALACEKAGFSPAPLVAFLRPGPAQSFLTRASSSQWQRVQIGAAWGAAFALGWMLFNGFGRRSRTVTVGALALFGACVSLAIVAVVAHRAYGIAADARAVVAWRTGTLRSIPTEADTSQKTTPLSAGSVAIADKDFLGWTRLTFENGQTGWVRKDEVVGLWKR